MESRTQMTGHGLRDPEIWRTHKSYCPPGVEGANEGGQRGSYGGVGKGQSVAGQPHGGLTCTG